MFQGKPINNSFTSGMVLDTIESMQLPNTYRYARNAILGDKNSYGYGLSNEEANELVATVGSPIVGHTFVERLNSSIIFAVGDIIGYFDHDLDEYKEIARASEFGCTWGFSECEYLDVEYKSVQPCDELYVYFSSKCTYYRVNISELLSPVRKAALVESIKAGNNSRSNCSHSCSYFHLLNCVCSPRMTASTSEISGHSLESGVYKFAFQLQDAEGNTTNFGEVGPPIYIGSKSNQAGEITSASVSVNLTGLDCRYDVVNIAVINGYGKCEVVASRQYSTDGITFTYYGQKGRAIDIEEIVTKGKKYLRGRSLEQKDSRLYLYNIRQEKNPNMQRRVFDSARLQFITIQTSAKLAERYNLKSLAREENYMFGVVYKYCDGTFSPVFLMSPSGGGGGSSSSSSSSDGQTAGRAVNFEDNQGGEDPAQGNSSAGATASSGSSFSAGSASTASGTEERYIRKRGNTRTGCTANCGCSGSGCSSGAGSGSTAGGLTPPSEEGEFRSEADPFDTNLGNWTESAKCNDCHPPVCCSTDSEGNVIITPLPDGGDCSGCDEDEIAIAADGPDLENTYADHTDDLTYWAWDTTKKPETSTIKAAAQQLIDAVNNAEVVERIKATYNVKTGVRTPGDGEEAPDTGNIENTTPGQTSPAGDVPWGDYHHNLTGKADLDGQIKIVEYWNPRTVTTENLYPDSKDCEGQSIYGGKANSNVELFGTPTAVQSPIIQPISKGVPNRFSPSSDPYYAADVRHIGIQVTGVPLPTNDEDWFPKPLCPNEPYRIVMVERDHINATVQANCLATSCFLANSGGQLHYFGRHGMCSKDKCDIHVMEGEEQSHKTDSSGAPGGYNLHGLDTNIGKVGLSGTKIRKNALVNAQGYRYGLYSEGKKPNDRLSGNRIDQRGARQMLNANLFVPERDEYNIQGLSYVNADEKSLPVTGVPDPVCNGYREASVFVKVDRSIGTEEDNSFKMDTMDHEVPISDAHGWNVSVIREVPDQYGAVPGMKFIDTGVRANGRNGSVKGFTGDVFIGPYSVKRTGYVSDKVGNLFPTPQ